MAVLKSKDRAKLSKSQFCMPDRKYPVPDRAHAANALARAKQQGVYDDVKPCVCDKYPDLPACKED